MNKKQYREEVIQKQRELLEQGVLDYGSQVDLADAIGIHRQRIARYLSGQAEMRWSTYLEIYDIIFGENE